MARIVIAGCGYVGTALALELLADGHEVFGLRRDPSGLPAGVRPLARDLVSSSPLDLPDDVNFGVYCVGADGGDETAYRAAYVEGLASFCRALSAQASPPRRVLFTSSTSVYAQHEGEWLDEASPTEPERFSGRILLEGEKLLAESGLPATVVRLGGIYGPGRTRLIERVARGEVLPATSAPQYTNRVHRDDAAGMLRFLMFGLPPGREPDELVLGVDSEPAPQADVVAFLAAELGVSRAIEAATAPASGGATNPSTSLRRAGSKRCSNARLLAAGYRFRYPTFRDGYRPVVKELLSRSPDAS